MIFPSNVKFECDWILPLNSVSMGCRWWNSCSMCDVNNNSKPFDYSTVKMPFKGTFLYIYIILFSNFHLMNLYATKSEYSNNFFLLKQPFNKFFINFFSERYAVPKRNTPKLKMPTNPKVQRKHHCVNERLLNWKYWTSTSIGMFTWNHAGMFVLWNVYILNFSHFAWHFHWGIEFRYNAQLKWDYYSIGL